MPIDYRLLVIPLLFLNRFLVFVWINSSFSSVRLYKVYCSAAANTGLSIG